MSVADDQSAAAIELADDRTLELRGHFDFDLHDRFKQHRLHLHEVFAEALLGSQLERHVGAIDVVVRTIVKTTRKPTSGNSAERAFVHARTETLLDRRNVLARNTTLHHIVDELEIFGRVFRQHFQPSLDVTVLAGTAGLLLALVIEFDVLRRRFTIADLRSTHFDFDSILALDTLDVDFQVQLAHAGDHRLAGFFVGGDLERGIFLAESLQGFAELVARLAVGRRDRHLDNRLRHEHVFQRAILRLAAVRVAAGAVDAHDRDDIARLGNIHFFALIGMHLHDAAEAFFLVGTLVVIRFALFDRALVDPHEGQLAERIFDDLERHADQRLRRIGRKRKRLRPGCPTSWRSVGRSSGDGKIAIDRRRAATARPCSCRPSPVNGRHVLLLHGIADDLVDHSIRDLVFAQQHFHQLVAVHGQAIRAFADGRFWPSSSNSAGICFFADLFALFAVEVIGLHRDQIDHAFEFVFLADRPLHQHGIAAQLLATIAHNALGFAPVRSILLMNAKRGT